MQTLHDPASARPSATQATFTAGMSALVALPWLAPWSLGPSTSMLQWLVSAACGALLLLALGLGGNIAGRAACLRAVALGWLLAALLSSAMALLQYFGWAGPLAPWVSVTDVGEAFANLRQRNQFATLTAIGLAALMCLRPPARWLWPALVLLAVADAASASRTGALQWLLLCGAGFFWAGADRALRRLAVGALLVYTVAVVALPALLQALTGVAHGGLLQRLGSPPNCESRLVLWRNVAELIGERPWAGWGWGGLKLAHFGYPYTGERFCAILDNAHNLPLHLAVELGLPAAAMVCAFALAAVWRGKPWAERDVARRMAWGVLAVIALHSLLEYPLWYGPFQLATALAVWMLWRTPPAGAAKIARAAYPGAAAALLVCSAALAWDYVRISQLYLTPDQRLAALREDTMEKVRNTWFFRDEVRFAELTTTPLTASTAAHLNGLALELLRFSPEARVVEMVLNSAALMHLDAGATATLRARFAAAYPQAYAQWLEGCSGCTPW